MLVAVNQTKGILMEVEDLENNIRLILKPLSYPVIAGMGKVSPMTARRFMNGASVSRETLICLHNAAKQYQNQVRSIEL